MITTRREFIKTTAAAALAAGFGRRALAGAPCGGPRPNILLVFPDQHRFDWTQLSGGVPVRTPNLARMAGDGTRFGHALCPVPLCAPSRACLTLGRIYGRTGVPTNKECLADGAVTLYTCLRDAGYRVGSTGKLDLRKPAYSWGPDGQHRVGDHVYFREWGFTDGLDSEGKGDTLKGGSNLRDPIGPYMNMLRARRDGSLETYIQWRKDRKNSALPQSNYSYTKPVAIADELYNDNWVGRSALELLESFPKKQPWFLQVNFPGPHAPMDITASMADLYKDTVFSQPVENTQLPAATHLQIRRNYSAMVENIDRWLGRYIDALERRGELENTLVVFCSDHGEMLGDHNLWGKRMPFQPSVSVPLVVRGPGVKRGALVRAPVATLDLTATFLDYAHAKNPPGMDSRSLRAALGGERDALPAHATSAYGPWRLVSDGRYKLIRGFDPSNPGGDDDDGASAKAAPDGARPESLALYDLEKDPGETTDIAPRHPGIVARLASKLPEAAA